MRAVIQRVKEAEVRVNKVATGRIGRGLLVFLGIERGDTEKDIEYIAAKLLNLRVFSDEKGNMNHCIKEVGGSLLVVSQFTLLGDVRKGRRPSFDRAEKPERSERLYETLIALLKGSGIHIEKGMFGAEMEVELINDGPVTILLDSRRIF